MNPVEKCLATLIHLIRANDVNGVPLSDTAIEDYLATERHRQIEALVELHVALEGGAPKNEFFGIVSDGIVQRRRHLMTAA
jgi:hypothetical protein